VSGPLYTASPGARYLRQSLLNLDLSRTYPPNLTKKRVLLGLWSNHLDCAPHAAPASFPGCTVLGRLRKV